VDAAVAATGERRRPARVELGVAYGLDVPTSTTWLRHGVVVRLGARLGRLPLAVELDGAFTSQPSGGPAGYAVTVRDLPFGLALDYRFERPRYLLAIGPRASLHALLLAASSPDGRTGSSTRWAAGLGAVAHARWQATDYLALDLTLHAEALVPHEQLLVDGMPAADLGVFQFGASAGVVFRVF
jgi:hypothetical protein